MHKGVCVGNNIRYCEEENVQNKPYFNDLMIIMVYNKI